MVLESIKRLIYSYHAILLETYQLQTFTRLAQHFHTGAYTQEHSSGYGLTRTDRRAGGSSESTPSSADAVEAGGDASGDVTGDVTGDVGALLSALLAAPRPLCSNPGQEGGRGPVGDGCPVAGEGGRPRGAGRPYPIPLSWRSIIRCFSSGSRYSAEGKPRVIELL